MSLTPPEEFGEFLRALLSGELTVGFVRAKGLARTPQTLASAVGKDPKTVQNWLKGIKISPDIDPTERAVLGERSPDENSIIADLRIRLCRLHELARLYQTAKVRDRRKRPSSTSEQKVRDASDSEKLRTVHRLTVQKSFIDYIKTKVGILRERDDALKDAITSLIKTNAFIRHPDDFTSVYVDALWYGSLVFLADNGNYYDHPALFDSRGKVSNRTHVLATEELNPDFSHEQWVYLDTMFLEIKDHYALLEEIRLYAESIDGNIEYEKWAGNLTTKWYVEASSYIDALKPRIDEVRRGRNDMIGMMMAIEHAAIVKSE